MWGWSEVYWLDRRCCGPAGGQWDNQDGKAAAGSVNDCGVGQGCTLPGWGYEVLFFQAAASTESPLPGLDDRMHGPQWNNTRIILIDARYPAIDAFYLVKTGGN